MRIAGVVLAAGRSTRLGRTKVRERIGTTTILGRVVDKAVAAGCAPLVVVARPGAGRGHLGLAPHQRAELVHARDPDAGPGASLAAGLGALADEDAAAVLLGDEPEIEIEVIRRALQRFRLTAPTALRVRYFDRPGHPVILGRALWPLLRSRMGGGGARGILADLEGVEDLHVDHPAPLDVDTEDDLRRLQGVRVWPARRSSL